MDIDNKPYFDKKPQVQTLNDFGNMSSLLDSI
jgi:hypothetical protein